MASPRAAVERATRFLQHDLWEDPRSPRLGWVYPRLRVLVLAIWEVQSHGTFTHAAALTYTSLLAVVPVLAVAFSLFQVFGGLEEIQKSLMDLVVQYIAPGLEAHLTDRIVEFTRNVRSGARESAILGTVLLFVTVIRTLANLEGTFNTIAGVTRGRTWWSRITLYWAVATLGPVLLGASIGMTATVRSSSFVMWLEQHTPLVEIVYRVAPALLTCATFALLYLFMPNAPVRPRAALAGGVLAGVFFEIAKVTFTSGAAALLGNYNRIYGGVAILFVFLLWIYISWTILLLGFELVVALQNVESRRIELTSPISLRGRELYASRLAVEIARRFHDGAEPPSAAELAAELELPRPVVDDMLALLERARVVQRVEGHGEPRLAPARMLEHVSLEDVRAAVRAAGGAPRALPRADAATARVVDALTRAEAAAAAVCEPETLRKLVEECAGEDAK